MLHRMVQLLEYKLLKEAAMVAPIATRIDRLSEASARRIIEPDVDLQGEVADGQVIADELLSVAGLGLTLSDEQRAALSRSLRL